MEEKTWLYFAITVPSTLVVLVAVWGFWYCLGGSWDPQVYATRRGGEKNDDDDVEMASPILRPRVSPQEVLPN